MSLIETMAIDGAQVIEVRQKLVRAFNASVQAAEDYAEAALGAAMDAYRAAEDGAVVAAAYTSYSESPRNAHRAGNMVQTAADIASLLCALNEGISEDANESYANHLMDMSRTDKVSAILEAAARRMALATSALPTDPAAPGARFNAAVFAKPTGS